MYASKKVNNKKWSKTKMKGTVKFFNEGKGFGFIAGEDGKEYFAHITGLNEGVRLHDNDAVSFDVEQGDRGPKAVNVSLDSGDSAPAEEASEDSSDDDFEDSSEDEASEEDSEDDE
jgi:cold shock protein